MSRQIVLDLRQCERIGIEPGKLLEDAANRIVELQLALWEINKRLNDKDSWLAQSIDCRNIAEAALGEKKDGN